MDQWGYCDPSCRTENVDDLHYNLASDYHSDLWSEDIFMLDTGSSGHCHTYNPVNQSFAGNRGQFYATLGKTKSRNTQI